MKYLRALEGLGSAFFLSLMISGIQIYAGFCLNFPGIDIKPDQGMPPAAYLLSALPYLLFIEFLIFVIIAIRTRMTAPKMGELQLRLPVVFPSGKVFKRKSIRWFVTEISMGLLLIPLTYFLLKFLENLAASQIPWQQLSEITVWSTAVIVFLTHAVLLIFDFLNLNEIREDGIVTTNSSYKWEQIFDYELLSGGQSHMEVWGTKYKVPKGYNALKIRYLRPHTWAQTHELLALVGEAPVFCREKDRVEIEKILSSNLPELSQEYRSNTLRFPVSGWEVFLENISTVINPTGIFHVFLAIDWQTITACQWEDCAWLRRPIGLDSRKKYYILRVRWTDHQRLKWTEIPVPAALVAQVQTQLLKYLPEHAEINLPPSR
jgi:hypothetical protein